MWLDGLFGRKGKRDADAMDMASGAGDPKLHRDMNGRLRPERPSQAPGRQKNKETPMLDAPKTPGQKTPDTSALNKQVVQAVQFTNTETADYGGELVATPPEMMVSNTTGIAVQDAANYMNGIMQIALAAQAVAIKKAAEGPVQAVEEIPLMAEIQKMVSEAVGVYGSVSDTAGTSAKTVIGDLKSS